jgi:hypothetical protein
VPLGPHPDSSDPALEGIAAVLDPILIPLGFAPVKQALRMATAR